MSIRIALAAIQRLQPGSFSRVVASGDATRSVREPGELTAPLSGMVRVGDVLIEVTAAPVADGCLAGQVAIVSGAASGRASPALRNMSPNASQTIR